MAEDENVIEAAPDKLPTLDSGPSPLVDEGAGAPAPAPDDTEGEAPSETWEDLRGRIDKHGHLKAAYEEDVNSRILEAQQAWWGQVTPTLEQMANDRKGARDQMAKAEQAFRSAYGRITELVDEGVTDAKTVLRHFMGVPGLVPALEAMASGKVESTVETQVEQARQRIAQEAAQQGAFQMEAWAVETALRGIGKPGLLVDWQKDRAKAQDLEGAGKALVGVLKKALEAEYKRGLADQGKANTEGLKVESRLGAGPDTGAKRGASGAGEWERYKNASPEEKGKYTAAEIDRLIAKYFLSQVS